MELEDPLLRTAVRFFLDKAMSKGWERLLEQSPDSITTMFRAWAEILGEPALSCTHVGKRGSSDYGRAHFPGELHDFSGHSTAAMAHHYPGADDRVRAARGNMSVTIRGKARSS